MSIHVEGVRDTFAFLWSWRCMDITPRAHSPSHREHEAVKGENQRETPESLLRVSSFSIPEMHQGRLQAFFNSIKYVSVHSRNVHLA